MAEWTGWPEWAGSWCQSGTLHACDFGCGEGGGAGEWGQAGGESGGARYGRSGRGAGTGQAGAGGEHSQTPLAELQGAPQRRAHLPGRQQIPQRVIVDLQGLQPQCQEAGPRAQAFLL